MGPSHRANPIQMVGRFPLWFRIPDLSRALGHFRKVQQRTYVLTATSV
jgi:hypothetical protein